MGFLDTLGSTLKSLGGAVAAPVGLVYDLSTAPFDDKDDDLSTLMRKVARRAGDVIDPLSNEKTATGYLFGKTMDGLTFAYHEGVDQPISTAMIMNSHQETKSGLGQLGALFDGEAWARAYGLAEHQSIGQSVVSEGTGTDVDPLAAKTTPFAENQWVKDHPTVANISAVGVDIATMWFLDPGVAAGKGAAMLRAQQLGKLRPKDRADFFEKLSDPSPSGVIARDWSGRVDRHHDFISGDNHLGRPLHADEIWQSSIELKRSSAGKAVAGLMADALKLPTHREQQLALRRIVAVGAGDASQIARLRAESESSAAIADALDNLTSGSTLKLELQALRGDVRYDPALNASFDKQLQNLDADGKVSQFVKDWKTKIETQQSANLRLAEVKDQLQFVPTAERRSGNRALRRENHSRFLSDKVLGSPDALIQRARDFAHRDSHTSVFQASANHVPLMLAHSTALLGSPYRAVPTFTDNMRRTHFTGMAKLDDWNGSLDQLDSMLRHAEVPDAIRHTTLSRAYGAATESAKNAAINHTESVAMDGIAGLISRKHGITVDSDWVKNTLMGGQMGRGMALGRANGGRIYATSAAPEAVALREKNAAKAKLQARADKAREKGEFGIASEADLADEFAAIDALPLRVDQILEEGIPLAVPLTIAQLGNRVPLLDIHRIKQLAEDGAWSERFARYGDAWKAERVELAGLEYRLKSAQVGSTVALERAIRAKRVMLDALTDAGSMLTRVWKFNVLFRMGYPIRILMDDHMRISTQVSYSTFVFGNGSEGASNAWYNSRLNFVNGRHREASSAYRTDQARRAALLEDHFGASRVPTAKEWVGVRAALRSPETPEAQRVLAEHDPLGKLREHHDRLAEASSLASSVQGHKGAISRWKKQLEEGDTKHALGVDRGFDPADIHRKIQAAEAEIAHKEAARAATASQLTDDAPDALMTELWGIEDRLRKGRSAYLPDAVRVGDRKGVKMDDGTVLEPAYAGTGMGYKAANSSSDSQAAMLDTLEADNLRLSSSGAHRTVAKNDPGYLYIYAQVLNHQFQHSPELMAFVRGKVETPEDFAKWLADPKRAYIRERMKQYAHDPVGWGSRLQQVFQDYLPTKALRDAVAKGKVSGRDIDRMVPDEWRPDVHTDLADVNTGRHTAVRMMTNGMDRAMGWLATTPTDRLSRHPFFNTMYRQHAKEIYGTRAAEAAKTGRKLDNFDLADIERASRKLALNDVRKTLWDISAHSSAAHTMRFLSPFFAAHQEALSRWWRIATDDPSVIRKFQLAFDAPRKAGLTYDYETGELVQEGDSPSAQHRIMLRLPGPLNSGANKWLKKMGGDHLWSVNENGFNLILQNGVANPGAGPLVTIPLESILQKHGSPELAKVVRILNPYPPDSPAQGLYPAWFKRMRAIQQGAGNREFENRLAANWADNLTSWRLAHDGAVPTESESDDLMAKATAESYADLWVMMASNALSPLPIKPESKHAVVQHGLSKTLSQMRAGGHDYEWAMDQFKSKYGDVFSALLASQGTNSSKLDLNFGEVNAMKNRRPILDRTDPTLARMIVGPDVAMDAKADPAMGRYDSTARTILSKMRTSPTGTETYIGTKSPDEMMLKTMADAGWTQYEQLTNYLQVQAESQGLATYDQSAQLKAARAAGLAYIRESNFAFDSDWRSYDFGAGFEGRLSDMRQIASYKPFLKDPTRSDVKWLGQYLLMRDGITAELKNRKAAGGASTASAKSNEDLMRAFTAGVAYIRKTSPFFDTYHYHGILERDPYLLAGDGDS